MLLELVAEAQGTASIKTPQTLFPSLRSPADMSAQLKYTSLTCALYQSGDKLGKLLAYASLLPAILVGCQASKVYWRREVHEAVLLLGMLLCEAVTRTLKHVLQHPRPDTCAALQLCHSHGMPSSHTSISFFYTTFTLLHSLSKLPRQRPLTAALTRLELLATVAAAAAVGASRAYLGYHSTAQVAAGAALGAALGAAWFLACRAASSSWGGLCRLPLCRQLGVKDTWSVADPLEVEAAAYDAKQHKQ